MERSDLLKLTAGVVMGAAMGCIWKGCLAEAATPFVAEPPPEEAGLAEETDAAQGIWIYYGSQTGTAEGFAKELEGEASGQDLIAKVVDLEDFREDVFVQHKVVILVVATYGEGDPTDNAVGFYAWLTNKDLSADLLKGMKFTVMGLGNRQYTHFNETSTVADARMEELGAERIYGRGVGDDDQNIEEDFEKWRENGLWPALHKAFGRSIDHQSSCASLGPRRFRPEEIIEALPLQVETSADPKQLRSDPMVQAGGMDIVGKWYFNARQAPVLVERELRQVTDKALGKTAKHIDFDVKSIPSLNWKTADNLEVLPRNPDDLVEWFAERLGAKDKLNDSITFVRIPGIEKPAKEPFPTPCTLRDALGLYCDLCTAPGKQAGKKLSAFINDPDERNFVENLMDDRVSYQWITGPGVRLNFKEFFELFLSSAQLDLSTFLQVCPRQKNRPYTIASSSLEEKQKIGICVSVVAEELKSLSAMVAGLKERSHDAPGAKALLASLGKKAEDSRNFRGLCSSMLCNRTKTGQKLWITSRTSTFRLPEKADVPVIMIGAGTGIAPFRGFVREFHAEGGTRPRTMLIFGCQKKDADFLYKEELQEAIKDRGAGKSRILGELVTAFSREQKEKVYVQNKLHERKTEVEAMLNDSGHIYVCGSTSMGSSIREEVAKILGSREQVGRMLKEGRYIEELW